jgi:hypothetical protein
MRHHIVVGHRGEVGSALYDLLRLNNPRGEAITGLDIGSPPSVRTSLPIHLHITLPWSESFYADVDEYLDLYDPDVVVVHSTVPIGTCNAHGWVHSPIRGRHPDLLDSLRTFRKHFGGAAAADAAAPFTDRGVNTEIHHSARTTEAGKLLELAQYGMQIRIVKEIDRFCRLQRLPFDEVYRRFAMTYNEGYRALGETRFVRPVLHPVPGPIGGHCVAQNAPLLGDDFVRAMLEPISPTEVDWDQPVDDPLDDMEPLW